MSAPSEMSVPFSWKGTTVNIHFSWDRLSQLAGEHGDDLNAYLDRAMQGDMSVTPGLAMLVTGEEVDVLQELPVAPLCNAMFAAYQLAFNGLEIDPKPTEAAETPGKRPLWERWWSRISPRGSQLEIAGASSGA